ncbi:ethanolamine ammonia-lyase subunit EutC [Christiangramia sp. SM2212]|uniref:Ethanolamine ammonia-lyase small subunit n=1 Tax=Christiangramia sediminicola TaxID=3073267 RepID=A0ABU1EQG5_9FLAO|nr:ethanolamine ammonia-lyase subunit EutC [Christiangramia sp. SM2212]MDR5590630.1 ethanolamine ammonia-lyase subunit EutC [Christiangramia sp. SM2212]
MAKEISKSNYLQKDPWENLRSLSKARIALGNSGGSLPTKEVLSFQEDHAFTKDAIYSDLKEEELSEKLKKIELPVYHFQTKVTDRKEYLKRPDLGKKLAQNSNDENEGFDILFILTDGLAADAINERAIPLLKEILPKLKNYKIGLCMVKYGRVAIGDEIAEELNAKFTAVLIGERPGLSSPKSLGIYTTYEPKPGTTDERRNCISNIHKNGLSIEKASELLRYFIKESFRRKLSGVKLKADSSNQDKLNF